jgi:hypothetical protein
MRALMPLLCSLGLLGCTIIHGQRNAPGHVKVQQPPPPRRVACAEAEIPYDPGERYLTLSTGVAFAGGPAFSRSDSISGTYALSVETSLHFGSRDRSHRDDAGLIPLGDEKYWPQWSVALNLGWHLLEREGDGAGVGAGYAELQLFSIKMLASGVAAGWAVDVGEEDHGPQFTLFTFGFMFVRVTHLLDRGTDLLFGLQYKIPISYVWSR